MRFTISVFQIFGQGEWLKRFIILIFKNVVMPRPKKSVKQSRIHFSGHSSDIWLTVEQRHTLSAFNGTVPELLKQTLQLFTMTICILDNLWSLSADICACITVFYVLLSNVAVPHMRLKFLKLLEFVASFTTNNTFSELCACFTENCNNYTFLLFHISEARMTQFVENLKSVWVCIMRVCKGVDWLTEGSCCYSITWT